ncbi:MAG: UDP-N-acetylglucosamine 2-epimerase (non-hydrolyzing) [Candidatus Lokiarchaeota archaeon]|nr:UDP-N-acetylglucosamine 2-epimerase (non-hydrolyzing) [Candidatus Harpocratesius repetitus]
MSKLKVAVVTGTRPELIKVSVLLRLLKEDPEINFIFVHSGQHYDDLMFKVFLEQLKLPEPDYNLNVGSLPNSVQTGKMLIELYKIIEKEKPQVILAQGDTNTVFAAGITAFKNDIPFGHIESGIRSFDLRMPEEVNRILVGPCAFFNFAPTKIAVENLLNEGIDPNRIFLVGNPIVEAVLENLNVAEKESQIEKQLNLKKGEKFILLTAHRPSNVDHKPNLENIIKSLLKFEEMKIIFPIHPRTKKNLINFNLWQEIQNKPHLQIIDPLKYLDMLKLMSLSYFIITDSGGLQEESTILKKPCITLRENTERPESVEIGANVLVGNDTQKLEYYMEKLWNDPNFYKSMVPTVNPYGDGKASIRMIEIIKKKWRMDLLSIPYIKYEKHYPHTRLVHLNGEGNNLTVKNFEKKCNCNIMQIFDSNGKTIIPSPNLVLKRFMFLKIRVLE